MIDLKTLSTGGVAEDTQVYKAKNLLTTQEGDLFFGPTFGIDIAGFVTSDLQIPPASFNAYILKKLIENFVDIKNVLPATSDFMLVYNYVTERK